MKPISIIAISMVAALGLTSPLLAEGKVTINSKEARNIVEISPYDLVTASYQGRFIDQGIPSSGRFVTAIRAKRIQAKDLVKSAIAAGRLSEETLNDKSYLRNVKSIMNNLDRN